MRVLEPTDAAVVLGSAEPLAHVDTARAAGAGVSVVRRRSGGGAVLVAPGAVLWVDLVLARDDPLWHADVGRAAWWVGELWAGALAAIGLKDLEVWRGGLLRGAWGDRVCFAGLGAGEVRTGGRKVVGVSQRRTRNGVLFQTAVLAEWRPAELLDVLALEPAARQRAVTELVPVATGVGAGRLEELLGALVSGLPGPAPVGTN